MIEIDDKKSFVSKGLMGRTEQRKEVKETEIERKPLQQTFT